MKRSITMLVAGTAALAGCSQGGESNAAGNIANAAASKAAAPKRSTWCFFKDAETKGWSAAAAPGGTVTVKGKGHVNDPRYRAELGQSEVSGTRASVWLAWGENRSYASPDNWWDVTFAVPGSAGVTDVTVMCGKQTIAELKVRR